MRILAVLAIVFILSACSAPEAPTSGNEVACTDFAEVTKDLAARMVEGSDSSNAEEFKSTMDAMPGRFDGAALAGDGEVAERIADLIDRLPDPVHMLFLNHDDYFDDVEKVDRACTSDGFEIDTYVWG